MSERLHNQSERSIDHKELERHAAERRKGLHEKLEQRAEATKEHDVNEARHEVERIAAEKERSEEKQIASPAEKRKDKLVRNSKTLDASFNAQMKEARTDMSAPSRTFSKVVHNKAVEKASEAIGSTVARPNAILAGSVTALIITASLYFWTRHVGYPLSGFETIGAFIIGWLVGIIFDFSRIMITGKR